MRLLERENQLAQLRRAFAALAEGGPGLCAVIAGESGIGKTSLVQAFVQGLPRGTKVLSCGCEALFTPRPLGPWVDIASHFPPPLAQALLRAPGAGSAFAPLLRHFAEAPAAQVLVMEDVHWADAGSLDLLHHLGRRLHGLRLMLVLTHRSAGLDAEHPLQSVLGALTAATTLRLTLPPLSPQAVETLARSARRSSAGLHAATGGNLFYVAEALASPEGVPPSVRDAVLGELARLAPEARRLAQWVSLFPARAERLLLESLDAEAAAALPANAAQRAARGRRRDGRLSPRAGPRCRLRGAAGAVAQRWPCGDPRGLRAATTGMAQRRERPRPPRWAHRVHHAEAAGLRAEVAVLAPRAVAHHRRGDRRAPRGGAPLRPGASAAEPEAGRCPARHAAGAMGRRADAGQPPPRSDCRARRRGARDPRPAWRRSTPRCRPACAGAAALVRRRWPRRVRADRPPGHRGAGAAGPSRELALAYKRRCRTRIWWARTWPAASCGACAPSRWPRSWRTTRPCATR
ncbi:MAG: AAA family ATPase [Rubrivivax sp.]